MSNKLYLQKLLKLNKIPTKEAKKHLNKLIVLQKNNDWLLKKEITTNFIIIAILFKYLPEKFTGQDLAKILKILTNHESEVGGPYFNENKKIDITTNIAIAYFLSLNEVVLPNLKKLIKEAIKNETLDDLSLLLLSKFYTQAPRAITIKNKDERIISNLLKTAENRFNELNKDIKKIALAEIKRTIKKNKDKQMSLISYYFKLSLGKNGTKISDDFILQAGLANIFYWTAFIIYDDFWDEDEKAIPSILPSANLYARHYIDFYNNVLPEKSGFREFFHNLMDKLDAANTWETIHCRTKVINSKFIIPEKLPDYKNYDFKFYPASGQILGPLAILIKLGFKLNSPEATNLTNYFKNYLIAMQINDDSHDWLEDMERGHLSTVVTIMIKDWQEKYPDKKEIDLKKDLKKLQEIFWFKTIKTAGELAVTYTTKSRIALNKLSFLENPAPLAYFIDIAENVAKKALNEQQKSLDFLEEWK